MNNQLINAVKDELGRDEYLKSTMQEVCNHGADAGFSGFIYYHETRAFFDANKSAIVDHAKELASDLGQGLLEMIAGFNCLNGNYSVDEIGAVIYGDDEDEDAQIKNAMAWFALEEASRHCTDSDDFSEEEQGGE